MNIISIIIALMIFSLIVIIHELGHFFFARKNDILVEEFAVGMGPKIVSKKYGDTVWSIRALPFGGFCKMLGEDESLDDNRAFNSKSIGARISTIFGGPLFNIILALLFAIIYISIGSTKTTTIETVAEDSPVALAGLQAGDKIIKVDGHYISAYKEIPIYINQNGSQPMELVYKRDGKKETVTITPSYNEKNDIYQIGIVNTRINNKNPFQVLKYSVIEIIFVIKLVYYSLGLLITGAVSAGEIAGPVGIVTVVSEGYQESIQYGLISVIYTISSFIVLLSANLGVMNLLPIPALDGGRLVFLFIELVRGKPIDQGKEGFIHFIGYVLLMALMVVVLFNDVRKLI